MYTQDNSIELREELGNHIGTKIHHERFFDYIKAENSSWPNVMFNLRLQLEDIEEFISCIKSGISKGKYPSILVTEIDDQGNEILSELEKRDIKVGHWSVMQHDLNNVPPAEYPQSYTIKRVTNSEQLSHWIRINETELIKGQMDERLFSSILTDENIHLFLGYENEIPVSTSLIFIQNKESGLYFIATDSKHRGKGFGKAITHHALVNAKSKGCSFMNLEATDAGVPVYEKVGFTNFGPVSLMDFSQAKK